ncbi:DUF1552 domain-containing protein [Paraliomyxa miuraensis]|uniref:DUF1552 domain-containing protein n=1 Tax=Paraliomyxa miuraensis TaxID=376150 RepID=UPI0022569B1F|nr:DUF1552 domain-containing protein [Paraliomyxa miuraensis]MCX4245306.1 DUF1552 domain-containing protein [Paraliomyxa miuraensis]
MSIIRPTRRDLLRYLGTSALALPIVGGRRPAFADHGEAHKRIIFFYTPNGTVPVNFWPSGGETDFVLSPILEPLAEHRDDLLILGNVDMESAFNGPGDAHQKGTGQCLTATELLEGTFAGDAGESAGWAGGISIDQKIAEVTGEQTLFPSIELGVLVGRSDVGGRINYRGAGEPVPPENDPAAAYTRIFGDPDASSSDLETQRMRRQRLLEQVSMDYQRLADRMEDQDREKLDIHISSLADIQDRLQQNGVQFGGECQMLDLGAPIDPTRVDMLPEIGRLQMDIMAMAMACDLTRVGTLMWTHSVADYVYSFLGEDIKDGHHSLAHKGDEDAPKVEHNTRLNVWFAEQFGYLISRLKAIPEGDGTVFDNTVIVWVNEQAKGNNHDRHAMPYVMAGSAGGFFSTGRYVIQDKAAAHNQLFVSLQNAMGIEDDEFGNTAYGKGELPGLRG